MTATAFLRFSMSDPRETRYVLVGPDEILGEDAPIYHMLSDEASLETIEEALRQRPRLVNEFSWFERSLLAIAAQERRLDVAKLLLEMGANPNGHDAEFVHGDYLVISPLHCAIYSEQPELVELLLEYGASPFRVEGVFSIAPYDIGINSDCQRIVELMRGTKGGAQKGGTKGDITDINEKQNQ